ncbi:MAG: hypothetical protein H0W72_09100 [Planctomycetes bacterium]|nr:hypothetical protein [Planctomycetota bacterium]
MRVILFLMLSTVVVAFAAEPARTGHFTTTFSQRSPWSAWPELARRYAWGSPDKPAPADTVYEIAKEPFDVYVPSSYDGTVPYGLVLYINSGKGGNTHQYASVMDRHKLIWIGAANVENDREVPIRIALTLDGLHNIASTYAIDPDRVYVSGTSGGGRTASQMGITFADVIGGGAIYLIGCNAPNMPADKDAAARVKAVMLERRYAFMTGSDDFNREGTISVHATYKGMKIPHLEYFETPGLGHDNPPVDWFMRAVEFCDRPLVERAAAALAQATALEAKGKLLDAHAAYRYAARCVPAVEVAAAAAPKLAAIAARIDAEASADFDKLLGQKPTSEKLRAFTKQWKDFPVARRAREQADALGAVELETVLAKEAKAQLAPLRKFVAAWDGYPIGERATAALDGHAKDAYAPVDALPAGDKRAKALLKFAGEWRPTATATAATESAEQELAALLASILALDKPQQRGQKLQGFLAAWKGTRAGAQAEAALNALIAELGAASAK